MAKAAKTEEKTEKKKPVPPKREAPEFGIAYLADELDREPHLVRVSLRRLKIEKVDGRYAWPSKKAADEVVAQLKKDPTEKKAKAPAEEKKADKKADAKKAKKG